MLQFELDFIAYGAETWTLLALDQKYLGGFAVLCWRRMEKITYADLRKNVEVLHTVKDG